MAFTRKTRSWLFRGSMVGGTLGIVVSLFVLDDPAIAVASCVVAFIGVFLSFQRIHCQNCGFSIWTISFKLIHCTKCGAKYPESD